MIAYGWAVGLTLWILAALTFAIIFGLIVENRDARIPYDDDTEEITMADKFIIRVFDTFLPGQGPRADHYDMAFNTREDAESYVHNIRAQGDTSFIRRIYPNTEENDK